MDFPKFTGTFPLVFYIKVRYKQKIDTAIDLYIEKLVNREDLAPLDLLIEVVDKTSIYAKIKVSKI